MVKLTYIKLEVDSLVTTINVEPGAKFFEYVKELSDTFKYFNEMFSVTGEGTGKTLGNCGLITSTLRMLEITFSIDGKPVTYKIDSMANRILETLLLDSVYYTAEHLHTSDNSPKIKYNAYFSPLHRTSTITDTKFSVITPVASPELQEIQKIIREIFSIEEIEDEYNITNKYLNLLHSDEIEPIHSADLPVFVSYTETINAIINMICKEDKLLDEDLAKSYYSKLVASKIKVRMLGKTPNTYK